MIKKNITINFCGSLYNIDEDAYELLQHYTDTIRRYFSNREGTEEVADDIEARIAEIFDELIASGANAINIEMTQDVIKRIGELSDIVPDGNSTDKQDEGEPESGSADIKMTMKNAWNTIRGSKRYYRDMGNKLICGVMAGLAQFFGGTPLIWRFSLLAICAIAICISNVSRFDAAPFIFTIAISYFVFAIIAPKAVAPEEVLQMKGKSVTPQNIAEEISIQQSKRGSVFGDIMSGIYRLILCVFCILVLMCFVVSLGALGVFIIQPIESFSFSNLVPEDLEVYYAVRTPLFFCMGAVVSILAVLSYCSFHGISSSVGKTPSMSFRQRLVWLIIFVASVAVLAGGIFTTAARVQTVLGERVEFNVNGDAIVYQNGEWRYYSKNDFVCVKLHNNTQRRVTHRGEYYSGNESKRYMDAYSATRNLVFQTERICCVSGSYDLGAVCRAAKGSTGAYIYAQVLSGDGKELSMHIEAIPAEGNVGNNILKTGMKYGLPSDWEVVPSSTLNRNKGYGWSYVEIKGIVVPEGATVLYGVTTDPEFTGKPSSVEWVSACDFRLSPVSASFSEGSVTNMDSVANSK